MGKVALLFLGGDVSKSDIGNLTNYDVVVCADSGISSARKYGIKPDYVIGDFDSASEEDLGWAKSNNSEMSVYPVDKDKTDGEICSNLIVELGINMVHLLGVFGGRIDHVFGNLQLLEYFQKMGIKALAYHDGFEVSVVSGKQEIKATKGDLVSVFALERSVRTKLSNLKYEYTGKLDTGTARGISNIALGDFTIESDGLLLLFHRRI